jgi:hypothetical protein
MLKRRGEGRKRPNLLDLVTQYKRVLNDGDRIPLRHDGIYLQYYTMWQHTKPAHARHMVHYCIWHQRRSVTGTDEKHGGPGLIPGQPMWGSWWITWLCSRFLPEYFLFSPIHVHLLATLYVRDSVIKQHLQEQGQESERRIFLRQSQDTAYNNNVMKIWGQDI